LEKVVSFRPDPTWYKYMEKHYFLNFLTHFRPKEAKEELEEQKVFSPFYQLCDVKLQYSRYCRPQNPLPSASKGSYSQVAFSYDGEGKDEPHFSDGEEDGDDDEDDDEEEDFNSDDSNDEVMESIAKDYGVKRYGWLVYMDKKAKEEERRQREVIKGDPAIRKLSRKERRKASQLEREREREAARITGSRVLHHDPYRESRRSPTYEAYSRSRRSRSRSLSYSPPHSRRYERGGKSDDIYQGKERAPKIEYITEFGGADDESEPKFEGYSPPPSPPSRTDPLNRPSAGRILEALHVDPASGVSVDKDKSAQMLKTPASASSALSKLNKTTSSSILSKQQGEKKETPQERLKRIMSKQLNKQIKKDTAVEMAKKREQEKQRLEKLAETSRVSRYRRRSRSRSYSRSPRRHRLSRSPIRERSSRRYRSRSRSRSWSRTRSHSRSHSPSRSYSSSHSLSRSISRSRSPRVRRRSRH
ncbi:PREDICTED: serine/arginine repetitive matrix protein 2-like, partial [Nicotiana attenuata]|uniref:serine/arginine repetitive matrix protein 2-like n=1 Tax=Nicotiana attenuata TaxID=49451 RepID=UPI000904DE6A